MHQVMENFLRIPEQDSAVEDQIDGGRLKFFTSKGKIWDYFSISQQNVSSLYFQECTSILKKYCHDLDTKFQVQVKFYLLFGSLFLGFLLLLLVFVVAIAVKKDF